MLQHSMMLAKKRCFLQYLRQGLSIVPFHTESEEVQLMWREENPLRISAIIFIPIQTIMSLK